MNISINDVKFLERKYNERPASGKVWELAQKGLSTREIDDIMKDREREEYESTSHPA